MSQQPHDPRAQQQPYQQPYGPQGTMTPGAHPGAQPGPVFAAPPAKPKKPWFKKWWVWLLAIILLIGISSALGNKGGGTASAPASQAVGGSASTEAAKPASSAAKPKEKLTLDDGWAVDKSNPYMLQVNGYVTNNTDKPITTYVQITFDTLDAQGANLGTCLANTNTIDANGKWKFKAICTGEAKDVANVRFKDLTGF